MVKYKLYNPNADKELPRMASSIDGIRKYAMSVLKEDWSIGYLAVVKINEHSSYMDKRPGIVVRNVKDYYTPKKILRFDYIVEANGNSRQRAVYPINKDGSIGKRRL